MDIKLAIFIFVFQQLKQSNWIDVNTTLLFFEQTFLNIPIDSFVLMRIRQVFKWYFRIDFLLVDSNSGRWRTPSSQHHFENRSKFSICTWWQSCFKSSNNANIKQHRSVQHCILCICFPFGLYCSPNIPITKVVHCQKQLVQATKLVCFAGSRFNFYNNVHPTIFSSPTGKEVLITWSLYKNL